MSKTITLSEETFAELCHLFAPVKRNLSAAALTEARSVFQQQMVAQQATTGEADGKPRT